MDHDIERGELPLLEVVEQSQENESWCCKNFISIMTCLNIVFFLGLMIGIVLAILKINNSL